MLNNYGFNKSYDRLVELGLNDQNINNLGLMTKKTLNEFISNEEMFPGHIIKYVFLHRENCYLILLHLIAIAHRI